MRSSTSSGPSPSRSMTPGRKPSISTSAFGEPGTRSAPSGCFRSTRRMERPCRSRSKRGRQRRGTAGLLQPFDAQHFGAHLGSIRPANGAGPIPAISITVSPASGPVLASGESAIMPHAISAPCGWRRRGGWSRRSASGFRRCAAPAPHIRTARPGARETAPRRQANPAPPAACRPSSAS